VNTALLGKLTFAFLQISLVAVGGANAVMPEVRRVVVKSNAWMTDETFTHLFAIAQAAPGPNVLLVSLVGWRLLGVVGMLAATLAMLGPSCLLAFAAGRVLSRWSARPIIGMLQQVLAPIAVGLLVASGLIIARAADGTLIAGAISASVAAFVFFTRKSPMWALAAAALGAILLRRLGLAV
jgi:chromate transporter